jgi:hypothetical protein
MNLSKWIFAALLSFSLYSCVSDRKVLDSWIEHNIKDVILRVGPPVQITSDGDGGKIYLFTDTNFGLYNGNTYYTYIFFYVYKDGTIYHWLEKKGTIPPQRINVDMYIH